MPAETSEESTLQLQDRLLKAHGRIDGLVYNAVSRPITPASRPMNTSFVLPSIALAVIVVASAAAAPSSLPAYAEEPVIYTGQLKSDRFHTDGNLPHALGVHSIQVMRANRTH